MSAPVTQVVVVGRDAPLWLAAGVVARALKDAGIAVQAVELPSTLTLAHVYPTLPPLEALHQALGLDESLLLRATRGAFSLGHNFADKAAGTPQFLHAYGSFGAAIDGSDFFAYWLKARHYGLGVGIEDFSLTASAARHGRLMIPDDETEVYGRADYAYHLPAQAYAALLKAVAVQAGVVAVEAATAEAELADGGIAALQLDGGRRVEGEMFLDATGEGALIAALGVAKESWGGYFPGKRVLIAATQRLPVLPIYAEIRASANGWTGLYPSQEATHAIHVHAGDDETALRDAIAVAGFDLTPVAAYALDQGCRTAAWSGNCVAIGEAACSFDPVHGVDLHAVQVGLINLLACFPVGGDYAAQRAEYNRVIASSFAHIRDFQSAHYACNRYGGSPFWGRHTVSPDLEHRIALFRARGEIAPWEEESFSPDSWRMLFTGHGLVPESWLPVIDRTSPEVMRENFRRMLGFVKEHVLRKPLHGEYLEQLHG